MTTPATATAPSVEAFQDVAVTISRLLRDAKVDPPLRPKALAAIMVAMSAGAVEKAPRKALASLNQQVARTLSARELEPGQRRGLAEVLRLSGADFDRLAPYIGSIASVLEDLNFDVSLASDCDFFSIFYEAFLRYGYDNNALGIVFTPRHIARFCVDLIGVCPEERVIDIACGAGGFLVAALDAMLNRQAVPDPMRDRHASQSGGAAIAGFDTNPTVWALGALNVMFRAGGQASRHLRLGNCFDPPNQKAVRRRFTRAFLNPPFSQDAEPERDFIDATIETLIPGGRCAIVVKAGIFADEEHAAWRAEFLHRHSVLGVISLPEEVFYPTAVPSSILLATAHVAQEDDAPVLMARVWNDGFEKLKNRRVERGGCELPEVQRCFHEMLRGGTFRSPLAIATRGAQLKDGAEWSPQEWLPQSSFAAASMRDGQREVVAAILRAVAQIPALSDSVLPDFTAPWQALPPLPRAQVGRLDEFFHVINGRSAGEKHYPAGTIPYVSSGGATNSIVRMVDAESDERFADGAITVTAFGQAAVQPWPFLARGNGGSSVRVLLPRFRMSFADLAHFAAQINAQQWRFFYARMAIKSRLERLSVTTPSITHPDTKPSIAERVREWRATLTEFSNI